MIYADMADSFHGFGRLTLRMAFVYLHLLTESYCLGPDDDSMTYFLYHNFVIYSYMQLAAKKLNCPRCLTRKQSNGKTEHDDAILGVPADRSWSVG